MKTIETATEYMTQEEFVAQLRELHKKNKEEMLKDADLMGKIKELLELKKQNAVQNEDPMEILSLTLKTIDSSFAYQQRGRFIVDRDEMAEMFNEINPADFMNMELCEFHFTNGKTIAINIAREGRDKFFDMINAVETPEAMLDFMVKFEEEKLKYTNLFHEEAGFHFDKANEYAKFNWANIILMNYDKTKKFHQPNLSKYKGVSAYIDAESKEIIYKIFFDTPLKVSVVKGTIKH